MSTTLKKLEHIIDSSDLWSLEQAHVRLLHSPTRAPIHDLYEKIIQDQPTFDFLTFIKKFTADRQLLCLTDMCAGSFLKLQAVDQWLDALRACQKLSVTQKLKQAKWLPVYIHLTQVRIYLAQGKLNDVNHIIESFTATKTHKKDPAILTAQHALVAILNG